MPAAALVITDDAMLWELVQRVAAATDVPTDRTATAPAIGTWRAAALVVVDASCLDGVSAAGLPPRDGVVVTATRPMAPDQWEACVRLGTRTVLGPPPDEAELVRLFAEAGEDGGRGGGGPVIAVVGACGGAGATVFSIALAVAAGRTTSQALLCDLDPSGAGVDVALGLEDIPGARWHDISASRGRISSDALVRALPSLPGRRARVAILTFGRGEPSPVDVAAATTVLDAISRGGGIAVVDVPRAASVAADQVIARAAMTVLVTPADVRGCYAAARAIPRLAALDASPHLVVRGPSPGGIGADDIASVLELPLLAAMRPQPGLDRALDSGRAAIAVARGPLARAAAATLRKAVGP